MTQPDERVSNRRPYHRSRPMPRQFSKWAWYRFARDRRRRYLDRLTGPLSNEQDARIEAMARLEWAALKANDEGSIRSDQQAREHWRLLDRLMKDFERELAEPAAPASPPNYAEVVSARQAS